MLKPLLENAEELVCVKYFVEIIFAESTTLRKLQWSLNRQTSAYSKWTQEGTQCDVCMYIVHCTSYMYVLKKILLSTSIILICQHSLVLKKRDKSHFKFFIYEIVYLGHTIALFIPILCLWELVCSFLRKNDRNT